MKTPRTDAAEFTVSYLDARNGRKAVSTDFARQLEIELKESNASHGKTLLMQIKTEKEKRYDEIFELIAKAEMEARNGNWMTCGTWCRNAMQKSYDFGNNDNPPNIRS